MNEKMSIMEIQSYFKKVLEQRGFNEQTVEDKMLLLIEEVGELAKAIRKNGKIGIDYGRIDQYDSVESEIADVVIVLISLCNVAEIDLYKVIAEKEKINSKREWK